MTPLCFILMPFGSKPVGSAIVDFDAVHAILLKPAVEAARLQPLRADEERAGGIIHRQMFERLVLCDMALADLSGANANVFYELGIRHGTRPGATVLVFAETTPPPFDLGPCRAIAYGIDANGKLTRPEQDRAAIAEALREAQRQRQDSPLYELLQGFPDLDHSKTDLFRDQVAYSERHKADLAAARRASDATAALLAVQQSLGPLEVAEAGVLVDLLLSFRDAEAHQAMLDLIAAMPAHLAKTVLVREQQAFALNRLKQREAARAVLEDLIKTRGPQPETNGLLGRVYKDLWKEALAAGRSAQARGLLDRAIKAYRDGFEADWRDHYPGINALQLMLQRNPQDPEIAALSPVVRYAMNRKLSRGHGDYWDYATALELAVLAGDDAGAHAALGEALACGPVPWMLQTTLDTLEMMRRGAGSVGMDAIAAELRAHIAPPVPGDGVRA